MVCKLICHNTVLKVNLYNQQGHVLSYCCVNLWSYNNGEYVSAVA